MVAGEMTPPKGIKVRGTCKGCGFVVETEAPKGRVTWRGPCPADGCHNKVVAHRVPGANTDRPDDPPADRPAGKRRARRVTSHGSGPSGGVGGPARRPAAPAAPAGDPDEHDYREPAGEPAGGDPARVKPPAAARSEHPEHRPRLVGALDLFD